MCREKAYLLENSLNILDNISVDDKLDFIKHDDLMMAVKGNVPIGLVRLHDNSDDLSGKVISIDKIGDKVWVQVEVY